ncbi:phosphonatase-like hydrolase [Mucilaginibacter pallidiroseus]|uniref:Phosphonatase-like hydrolase n=1 Tax=Mucilaginibacter pallidiroseus TaxID=2599295 RepID=A0A563UE37_9SPHI|nr:phosphonatase-like hydrolase [Mucilaginibacter pallidiroseus]TWR29610.1 phosphonatase-like hydrolase [Mucilaginibacter pallidiroseus]
MAILIKMVVFDMAGTTIDEQNIVYKTLHKAILNAGYSVSLNDVLEVGAGMEKLQAIKSILLKKADVTDEQVALTIFADFATGLDHAYSNSEIAPQPGALATFTALKQKGIAVVLNTGYSGRVAKTIVDKLGWQKGREYDELITASDVSNGRPAPDMILMAANKFNVEPIQIVKVGDSVIDIEEGKNAGCAMSIGITTGAHTFDQLQAANPDHIINNLQELLELI